MKQVNISIHPFSALVGMAVLSMVWVTAAAMPLPGSSSDRDVSAIEVVSDPHPRDFVRVVQGTPYTVPSGKVFVVTGVGAYFSNNGTFEYFIHVDGANVWAERRTCGNVECDPLGIELPSPGIAVGAGSVVTVDEHMNSAGVLLGYLVDA